MKASDLDYDTDCPGCNGTGEPIDGDGHDVCRVCQGSASINRYQDAESGRVILRVDYEKDVLVHVARHQMAESTGGAGGFDERYGPSTVQTPPDGAPQDLIDQVTSKPLGNNGAYDIDGNTVSASDLHKDVWPSSCPDCPDGANGDLCIDHIITWHRARGDEEHASVFEQIKSELP